MASLLNKRKRITVHIKTLSGCFYPNQFTKKEDIKAKKEELKDHALSELSKATPPHVNYLMF